MQALDLIGALEGAREEITCFLFLSLRSVERKSV